MSKIILSQNQSCSRERVLEFACLTRFVLQALLHRPSMHSFNLPFITQGGIFWNFPIEIQWLKFIILLLLSQYQLLHFCTSESLIDPLSYIKRWSSFHKCRSKEVQIVYTLLQVNLLHVPRFPTQPASYMGGWVIDSIGWNCLDKYIAMTRNNLSIIWISLHCTACFQKCNLISAYVMRYETDMIITCIVGFGDV